MNEPCCSNLQVHQYSLLDLESLLCSISYFSRCPISREFVTSLAFSFFKPVPFLWAFSQILTQVLLIKHCKILSIGMCFSLSGAFAIFQERQQHPSVFFQANIKLAAFKLKMNLKYSQWSCVFYVSEFKNPESGSEFIQLCIFLRGSMTQGVGWGFLCVFLFVFCCCFVWGFFFVCCRFNQDCKICLSKNLQVSFPPAVVMKGRNYKVFWYVVLHSTKFSNIMQSTNSPSTGYSAGELGMS